MKRSIKTVLIWTVVAVLYAVAVSVAIWVISLVADDTVSTLTG